MPKLIDADELVYRVSQNFIDCVFYQPCDFLDIIYDMPAADDWISVEDDLPKNTERVLVVVLHEDCHISIEIHRYSPHYRKWWVGESGATVTHWRPLPELPAII